MKFWHLRSPMGDHEALSPRTRSESVSGGGGEAPAEPGWGRDGAPREGEAPAGPLPPRGSAGASPSPETGSRDRLSFVGWFESAGPTDGPGEREGLADPIHATRLRSG